MTTFGQIAFNSFEEYITNLPTPPTMIMVGICKWEDLPVEVKVAWEAAGQAILRFLDDQSKTHPSAFVERHNHRD